MLGWEHREVVLLYDRACGGCCWVVQRLLAFDRGGRIGVAPIDSSRGAVLLAGLDRAARDGSWHLVDPTTGARASGGAVLTPLLTRLPALRPAARVTGVVPARGLDRLYELAARHRSWWSRLIPRRARERARLELDRRADRVVP